LRENNAGRTLGRDEGMGECFLYRFLLRKEVTGRDGKKVYRVKRAELRRHYYKIHASTVAGGGRECLYERRR